MRRSPATTHLFVVALLLGNFFVAFDGVVTISLPCAFFLLRIGSKVQLFRLFKLTIFFDRSHFQLLKLGWRVVASDPSFSLQPIAGVAPGALTLKMGNFVQFNAFAAHFGDPKRKQCLLNLMLGLGGFEIGFFQG